MANDEDDPRGDGPKGLLSAAEREVAEAEEATRQIEEQLREMRNRSRISSVGSAADPRAFGLDARRSDMGIEVPRDGTAPGQPRRQSSFTTSERRAAALVAARGRMAPSGCDPGDVVADRSGMLMRRRGSFTTAERRAAAIAVAKGRRASAHELIIPPLASPPRRADPPRATHRRGSQQSIMSIDESRRHGSSGEQSPEPQQPQHAPAAEGRPPAAGGVERARSPQADSRAPAASSTPSPPPSEPDLAMLPLSGPVPTGPRTQPKRFSCERAPNAATSFLVGRGEPIPTPVVGGGHSAHGHSAHGRRRGLTPTAALSASAAVEESGGGGRGAHGGGGGGGSGPKMRASIRPSALGMMACCSGFGTKPASSQSDGGAPQKNPMPGPTVVPRGGRLPRRSIKDKDKATLPAARKLLRGHTISGLHLPKPDGSSSEFDSTPLTGGVGEESHHRHHDHDHTLGPRGWTDHPQGSQPHDGELGVYDNHWWQEGDGEHAPSGRAEPDAGIDFDEIENEVSERALAWGGAESRPPAALMLLLTVAIAACTAVIATVLSRSIEFIFSHKLALVERAAEDDPHGIRGWLTLLSLNLALVAGACGMVVWVEQRAKGSGIPEVKSYLNGRRIPNVISSRTLISKMAGLVFGVCANLNVGKEGPMIHSGAIFGSMLPAALGRWLPAHSSLYGLWTTSVERDFVSIGCACGVAGAFAAPIGGVLFVLEEAATVQHWHVALTSAAFFGACVTAVAVSAAASLRTSDWGNLSQSALVSFGSFEGASKPVTYADEKPWGLYELPAFILLGVLGGLAGAAFNGTNVILTKWRMARVSSRWAKLFDALAVSALTSTLLFYAPYLWPCVESAGMPFESRESDGLRLRLNCPEGEVSILGSLTLEQLDEAVKTLFHAPGWLPLSGLCGGCALYFFTALITYGISIPSGLFVPAILVGAFGGRLVGQILALLLGDDSVDPGAMALVGAASFLAGVTRVTISAVVIVIETTSNINYAIPVAIAILVSKHVGDLFNGGLYDEHIALQGICFLYDEMPDPLRYLRASDVATAPVMCFPEVVRVRRVLQALRNSPHNGFPVTYAIAGEPGRKFSGLILRQQLLILLKTKRFAAVRGERPAKRGARDADQLPTRGGLPHTAPADGVMTDVGGGVRADSITSLDAPTPPPPPPPLAEEPRKVLRSKLLSASSAASEAAAFASVDGDEIDRYESSVSADSDPAHPHGESGGEVPPSATDASGLGGSTAAGAMPAPPSPLCRTGSVTSAGSAGSHARNPARRRVATEHETELQLRADDQPPVLGWQTFAKHFNVELAVEDIMLSDDECEQWLDLTPYMNVSATTIHHSTYLGRVHLFFRNLGLRHLTVVDSQNAVVGIITRRDVTELIRSAALHSLW